MPDFERLSDILMTDVAKTPEEKAYWIGWRDGKSQARKEMMVLCVGIAIIIVCVKILYIHFNV